MNNTQFFIVVFGGVFLFVVVFFLPESFSIRINATSTLMVALATVALAVVAWQAVGREKKKDTEHELAANARVSAIAFPLRRQLVSWVSEEPWPTSDLSRSRRAQQITRHLDAAEVRVEGMLAEAANASVGHSRSARVAAALFYEAAGLINATAASREDPLEQDDYGDVLSVKLLDVNGEEFDAVENLLNECAERLNEIIDSELRGIHSLAIERNASNGTASLGTEDVAKE